jgi:hypothetical protein
MKRVTAILLLIVFSRCAYAQVIDDYLITSDIGTYKQITKGGSSGDILAGSDHFGEDHQDESYGISYHNKQVRLWVDVQVTRHTDPTDSTKWLLHEVDRDFRNYYGIPGKSFGPRQINGQTIIENLVAGASYRWLSGSKVIVIEYRDSTMTMTKPEPLEVIQAYITKHPSAMQAFTLEELRSSAGKTIWIKDEMDRRLWLCDKWFMQLQLRKVEEKQVYQEAVKSMNIFLDYREKYYGLKAADEKNLLSSYLYNNNGTGVKAKLTEYKNWWTVNKEKAISL